MRWLTCNSVGAVAEPDLSELGLLVEGPTLALLMGSGGINFGASTLRHEHNQRLAWLGSLSQGWG